ncbi:MAG: PspC domain-containing protein [Euzebya sp.]
MTATTSTEPRRLYRSTQDKRVAGVCGGIAQVMGWDPTVVRLVAVLSILLPGPQALAYIIAWALLPTDRQLFHGRLCDTGA